MCAFIIFLPCERYDECLFTLVAAQANFNDAQVICQARAPRGSFHDAKALADDFETLRCPSALLDSEECFSQDSEERFLSEYARLLLKGLPIQLRQLAQM